MISNKEFEVIAALDLNPIKVKLMHKESGEGWSLDKANATEIEYRRFLYLMKAFPNEETAPLVDVDTFWHYHILDTMKYARDCEQAFGYFLHHYPYIGLRGEDDVAVQEQAGDRMRELYEATFGESYLKQADGAWCGRAPEDVATAAGQAAWCGRAPASAEGATQTAWCGRAPAAAAEGAQTAWCGRAPATAEGATQTAWCGRAPAEGATQTAWCGRAPVKAIAAAVQTAWCGRAPESAKETAWCGRAPVEASTGKSAWCGRAPEARQTAWCGRAPADTAVNSAAEAQTAWCGRAPADTAAAAELQTAWCGRAPLAA